MMSDDLKLTGDFNFTSLRDRIAAVVTEQLFQEYERGWSAGYSQGSSDAEEAL